MKTDTRDRLNKRLTEPDFTGKTVDQLLDYLLTEEWKRKVIEDWDRLHAQRPGSPTGE